MKYRFLNPFVLCILTHVAGFLLSAQDIQVRLVNGKNGKPVSDECLNISIGGWHGADLIAPTNHDGILALHLENGGIATNAVAPRACNGMALTTSRAVARTAELIAVLPNWQILCERRATRAPGEPVEVDKLVPSYSIQEILDSGHTAANTCGKFRMKAKPGELVLFVRPPTFGEAMRR